MLAFGSNQVLAGQCLGRRARLPTTAPGNGSGIRFASSGYSPTQAFCQPTVRVSAGALPLSCTGRVGRAATTGTAGGVLAKLAAQHRSGRAHRAVGLRRAPLPQRGQCRTRPSVWGKLRSAAGTRTLASPFRRARSEPDPAAPSNFDDLKALQRLNTLSALRQTLRGSRPLRIGQRSPRRELRARCPNASVAGMHGHSRLAAPDAKTSWSPPCPRATPNCWHRHLRGHDQRAGAAGARLRRSSASGPIGQGWATAARTTRSGLRAK